MANVFTETSRESWFSRIKGAIVGVLIGFLLVPGSMVLIFWNESRAINETYKLNEGEATVVKDVPINRVDGSLEGKLVHVSGMVETDEVLKDDQFLINQQGLQLVREVEMYQWDEDEKTEESRGSGGSKETKKTYTYELGWHSGRKNSESFKMPENHENPSLPFQAMRIQAEAATLGAFQFPENKIAAINNWKDYSLDQAWLEGLSTDLKMHSVLDQQRLYYRRPDVTVTADNTKSESTEIQPKSDLATDAQDESQANQAEDSSETQGNPEAESIAQLKPVAIDVTKPNLGDVRVSFRYVPNSEVTLISSQHQNSFRPQVTKYGELELMELGTLSAEQVFKSAHDANSMMTWILRFVGFILMGVGFCMIMRPLSVLVDIVPFLGGIAGFGIGVLGFGMAAVLSSLTIAIAWVAVRPVFAVALIVFAIGVVVLLVIFRKPKNVGHDHGVELVR